MEIVDQEHPITKPMKSWITTKEELYNNAEVFDAHALAIGNQTYKKGGKDVTDSAIVAWVNTKHGAPSFSTSLGHYNEVVQSEEYLNLITRGALWACGKIDNPAYMTPYTGSNTVTEIPAKPAKKKAVKSARLSLGTKLGTPPANAIFVKVTAQSTQTGNGHHTWQAVDNNPKTRWCANSGDKPAWIQFDLRETRHPQWCRNRLGASQRVDAV